MEIINLKKLNLFLFIGFCCVKYQVCTDAGAYTLHNSDLDADPTTNQGRYT